MDFVRLGPAYSYNYIPDKLIEGYNSLIWTERYDTHGEFELKSFDVYGLLTLLPEDTLVSHLETKEVMVVETHEINMVGEGADARPEITIRGRTASMILEQREIASGYQMKRSMRYAYSATSALCVLLYQAVDNVSGKDVTRGDDDPDTEGVVNDYSWSLSDVIPNIHVTESVASEGSARWWQLEWGILWPQFQKILQDADLGIRTIRPVSPNPGTTITVHSTLSTRGTIVRTASSDLPGLRFEVYQGVDRTATVQLSQLQGHLDKPSYLISKREYKSRVDVMSGVTGVSDVYRPGEAGFAGWQRRTMMYDAGSPELPPRPEPPEPLDETPTTGEKSDYYAALAVYKNKLNKWKIRRDNIYARFRTEQSARALRDLKLARRTNMFAGDISLIAPYQYKVHYNLGDKIKLVGDYGKNSTMIVQEYVRTEDANGDRGFPGLVEP